MRKAAARALAAAWLFAAPAAAAECGALGGLLDELGPVGQANALLERAARGGGPTAADAAEARRLIGALDRLRARRACYLDRIDEARALAAGEGAGAAAGAMPALRRQRDALLAYRDGLPGGFAAGHGALTATVQSLNLAIAAEAERAGAASADEDSREALAELLLHAAVSARIAFAHVDAARARLQTGIIDRRAGEAGRAAAAALAGLDDFVERALAYNGRVVSDPGLSRRFGKIMARGEYPLGGARFDRERHCRLAEFKASETLDSLAAGLGVAVVGETLDSCARVGGSAVAWLSAPEENMIRFR